MEKNKKQTILPVSYDSKPKDDIRLFAFAFNQIGELVEKTEVKEERAAFETLDKDLQHYRFLFAPLNEKTLRADTIEELLKWKAFEPVLEFDPKGNITLLPIPDYYTSFWYLRRCRVKGKLIKAFTLHGATQDKPVCHARVHICEVDKIYWLLPKIPDHIIKKIPDFLFEPNLPIPLPEGPWPPIPDPIGPIINPGFASTINRDILFNPKTAPGVQYTRQATEKKISQEINTLSAKLTPTIQAELLTGNVNTIRDSIIRNFDLFHPIFCYMPWIWPYFYACDEIKTVYTNQYGLFDTTIYYTTPGDHPDLYFWVEYFINGSWVTVYRPSIACHTYWDYLCGSDVTIRITDARVPWRCDNIIYGSKIWIKTIGRNTSVSSIKQENTIGTTSQGHNYKEQGLTDVSLDYSPNRFGGYRRPFGGSMYFLVQFSFDLPNSGIKYYRWSRRKTKNADMSPASGTTEHLRNPLAKGYHFSYFVGGDLRLDGYDTYNLGPLNIGAQQDLYLIPPVDVNTISNPTQLYPWWSEGQNTISVAFDSNSLNGDGLYEFTLELFDATGNKIEVAPALFQVPHPATFTPHINAPAINLDINTITGNARAFKMVMRVDNNAAEGEIYKIKVDPENDGVFIDSAADCCGFVKYNGAADTDHQTRISFRAYHPHNFADFDFGVLRGTCGDTVASDTAMVIGSSAKYSRSAASIFSHDFTPKELLDSCALKAGPTGMIDGKAAFAEILHVQPLAVNGDTQVFGNIGTAAAFALEPQ
jgi:hypothetical protein